MPAKKDLTDQLFGILTAVEAVGKTTSGHTKWLCSCMCGNQCEVSGDKLTSGHTKSCGCLKTLTDLEGRQFGRLLVLQQIPNRRRDKRILWLCACSCGRGCEVTGSALIKGTTQSCGCLAKELSSERNATHGESASREYNSWVAMKKRCTYPDHIAYERYGGRGITVCPEWMNSFEQFLKDMGPRPNNTSIDRIDPDGNYEPSNCRWASPAVQRANRSVKKIETHITR